MEYEYAVSESKPVLGFLHADPDSLSVARSELNETAREALNNFRALVAKKQCRTWATPEELGGLVSRSVIRMRKSHPRPGWVRADTNGDLALRERIIELESRILTLQSERSRSLIAEGMTLEGGDERTNVEIETLDGETINVAFTWNEILIALTRSTLDLVDRDQLSAQLASSLRHSEINPDDVLKLSTESITRIIIYMLASDVLERRQYEYRITGVGIGIAANLQLRMK